MRRLTAHRRFCHSRSCARTPSCSGAIAAAPGASLFQAISEGNATAVAALLPNGRIDLGTLPPPTTGLNLVIHPAEIVSASLHKALAQKLPLRAASSMHLT